MASLSSVLKSAFVTSLFVLNSVANPLPRFATLVSRKTVSQTQYDFIVAGGGIAGLTAADRLTEDPKVKVLVIEAGPFDQGEDNVLIPGQWDFSRYVAILQSEPQTALNNQSYIVPFGRAVGGGSVVNWLVWLRSAKAEYDSWETQLGDAGWSWDTLLPYFKKSETFTPPSADYAHKGNISWIESVHGRNGPVHVSYPNFFWEGSANWWNGALEAGFTPAKDPNSGDSIGIAWYTTSVDFQNRTRSDARIVHYDRVSARKNYHILAESTVSKVIFRGKKATGVEFIPSAGGNATQVTASKEVLIAAGGVNSPKILQLSGIGPKSLLEKYGIGVVSDLPGVGANFHDTPHVNIPYNVTNNIVPNTNTLNTNATYDAEQHALYESSRQGAYTIIRSLSTTLGMYTLCDATSDCSSIIAKAEAADPATYLPKDSDPTVIAGYTAQRKAILDQLKGDKVPAALVTWGSGNETVLFMAKPLSRGYVAISSVDPLASPIIDYGSMLDPVDFDVLIATFLKNRDIMQAPSMKVLGAHEAPPVGDDIVDHDALREALKKILTPTTGHECCTAAMAPLKHGGVVNTNMEVYGVQGLRVIDISTLPMLVATPPAPTIYGIAEKISDAIKKKYCLAGSC